MDDIHIGTIEKNKAEEVRVTLRKYNGHDLLSMHVWFVAKDGKWLPGSKGLTVDVRMIPELRILLAKAEKEAKRLGLLSEEPA